MSAWAATARARRALLAAGCALAAAAVPAACGRVGSPRPPEMVIPMMPDPITVESAPDGIKVTWRRPREYVDGEALDDLAGFRVLRACQPEASFAEVTVVPVVDQQRFRKASTFSMLDHAAPLGVPCRYQVIAFTFDEYTSPPAESADVIRTVPGAVP
jgi:hypothetical protein